MTKKKQLKTQATVKVKKVLSKTQNSDALPPEKSLNKKNIPLRSPKTQEASKSQSILSPMSAIKKKAAILYPNNNNNSTPLFRGEKKKYYDALITLKDQITGQVRNLTAASLTSNKQAGEELADIGSDNFNREIGLAMVTEDGKKLSLIQDAIERLSSGTYGICFDCGGKIGVGRLQAIPYSKLCIDCKSKREEMEKMEINEEELFFDKETETTTFDKTDAEEQDEERDEKDGEEEEKS